VIFHSYVSLPEGNTVLFRELLAEGDVSLKNPGFAAAARNRKAG